MPLKSGRRPDLRTVHAGPPNPWHQDMSRSGSPRMIGVGGVFIDDIVLPSGETRMASLGGAAVHALMGAAVWGERSGIVAPIGRGFPDALMGLLEENLDVRGLRRIEIEQMRAWQIAEQDGRRRELYRVA